MSGHWLTAGPGSVESVGGCSGLLFSQVCALGFRSEVVNATVAVDQGCPMKGRWQGTPKRRPGRFRQDVRRGVRTCCQRASFVLSFLLPAPGHGVWGQWADLSLGRGVVLEGIVRKMDLGECSRPCLKERLGVQVLCHLVGTCAGGKRGHRSWWRPPTGVFREDRLLLWLSRQPAFLLLGALIPCGAQEPYREHEGLVFDDLPQPS